jgi:hypothetical protein
VRRRILQQLAKQSAILLSQLEIAKVYLTVGLKQKLELVLGGKQEAVQLE